MPAILLVAYIPFVVGGIVKLGETPDGAITIDVTGQRFSWEFAYPNPDGDEPVLAPPGESGAELHIPVGQDIEVTLNSIDVIHSFWVPKLAGKTDVVPGRVNRMWFNADEAGTYAAQCAEFCGTGHGVMRFTVIAESQANYDAYISGLVAAQDGNGDRDRSLQTQGR